MKRKSRLLIHLAVALTLLPMSTPGRETPGVGKATLAGPAQQVYSGNIIYFGGRGRTGSTVTTFRLTIDRFTPEAEVARLAEILKTSGQDALLKAITGQKRGTIQIDTQLARDVNAVWLTEGPEGEHRITALSERWIGISEARRGTRSLDYPFTFIDIYVEGGKGEGELIPAAKVRAKDGKTWEVENFGIYPARLTNIRARGDNL
jgi:hypothetical protein